MKIAVLGLGLLLLGALAVVTGILPWDAVVAIWLRVWPILLFAVSITVVAELAADAGLFSVLADRLARAARGRALVLWLFVVAIAVVTTAFLSLDTTAVLLTPVVVLLAQGAGLSPLPFAITTVWLANTASLVLPVSNLTNLLAAHALGFTDASRFVLLLGPSALVAIVVPVVAIFLLARKQLLVRFDHTPPPPTTDRVLLVASAVVVAAVLPFLVIGVPPWIPATGAAIVLGVVFLVRRPAVVRFSLVPWQLVLFASGLFLVVDALHALGSTPVLAAIAGSGTGPLDLLRMSFTGLAGANVGDNLPAYLALEPVAGPSEQRLGALLVGVNAGSLITPWASLATLLWHSRLVSLGVELRWSRYVLLGAVVAPVTVALATLPLALR